MQKKYDWIEFYNQTVKEKSSSVLLLLLAEGKNIEDQSNFFFLSLFLALTLWFTLHDRIFYNFSIYSAVTVVD